MYKTINVVPLIMLLVYWCVYRKPFSLKEFLLYADFHLGILFRYDGW